MTEKPKHAKAKAIHVKNLLTGEEKDFSSYAEAERYFNQKPKSFSSKAYKRGDSFTYKNEF